MRRDNPLHRKRRVRAVLAEAGFGVPRRHQADAAEGAQGGQVTDFPTLIRIAPQTALAIAAGLPAQYWSEDSGKWEKKAEKA